jgi:hypothetical protein
MHEEMIPAGREPWPLRPVLFAALGLATGLAVHAILGEKWNGLSATQSASAVFLTVLAGLIIFTLERLRWIWALGFAVVGAAVAAAIFYWSGDTASWSATEGWRMVSLFLSIAIAAPLFQAARDAGAPRFAYPRVYDNAWTNVVLWCGGWGFTGIVFLMTGLLASLFGLIGIDFLQKLLEKQWFDFALGGASYGASVGLFRERDPIVRLARRVLAAVLSVLAPLLGAGLLLFLLALPFTGLHTLWDATKATTPILLACAIGSLALATIVTGGDPDEEARNPLLRFGAMALGLGVLPLAILAAIATGLRIGQYGFTPERLWGLVFVILATVCGVAYLLDLVRGRLAWAARIRPTNLVLAFLICGTALLLATPILSFNEISTRDQVSRLEAGKVKPDKFDWAALAFDFGEPGKAALKKLESVRDPLVSKFARAAGSAGTRWEAAAIAEDNEKKEKVANQLRLLPAGAVLPDALRDVVAGNGTCSGSEHCTLLLLAGGQEAMLFRDFCFTAIEQSQSERGKSAWVISGPLNCIPYDRYVLRGGKWLSAADAEASPADVAVATRNAGYKAGQIEVRTVQARRVFVGGVPVGAPFE